MPYIHIHKCYSIYYYLAGLQFQRYSFVSVFHKSRHHAFSQSISFGYRVALIDICMLSFFIFFLFFLFCMYLEGMGADRETSRTP